MGFAWQIKYEKGGIVMRFQRKMSILGSARRTACLCTVVAAALCLSVGTQATLGQTCTIDTVVYNDGDLNAANSCQVCDSAQSTTDWTDLADGASCDDGLDCTSDETCDSVVCQGGTPDVGTCLIGGVCYADSDVNPGNQCEECFSMIADDAWVAVANSTPCEDGEYCSVDDSCQGGVCTAGDPRDCSAFDDQCNTGVCNESADACEADPTSHENDPCDDGFFCNDGETCQGGNCIGGVAHDCSDSGPFPECTIDTCNEGNNECDHVTETEPPSFNATPGQLDVTVGCDESTDPADILSPTITDNVEVNTDNSYYYDNVTGLTGCNGTGVLVRTWYAEDVCGNSDVYVQQITIVDNDPPAFSTAASDVTVECDGIGNQDDLDDWLADHGGAEAADNCGDVTWSYLPDPANISSACGATGSVTVTFTATDGCGNTSDTTATFTIEDTTAPTITTQAADAYVECDGLGNTSDLDDWLADNGGAVATDSCGNVDWSYDPDPANIVGACGATGSVTVTFTATDDCGNASDTTATFIIEDTTDPTITMQAANKEVECDGLGNTADLDDWLLDNGGAVASDGCGNVDWSYDPDPANIVGACGETGSVEVTFTATDDCGNTADTTATFTIVDTSDPVITTQATDKDVECDGSGNVSDLDDWLADHGGAEATDDCGDVSWSYLPDPANISDECGETGSVEVTFTATDDCGHTASTTATFTIEDTIDPVIDFAAENETVECDGEGNVAELDAWLANHGNAEADDDCSDVTWSFDPDPAEITDECGATGSVTVTFTATDDCGNSDDTVATFTIEDTTSPTIDTPAADKTVECDGAGNLSALNDWLASNGGAVASDACSDVLWSYSPDPATISDECGATGAVTVTFTATDDCGNSSDTTATFTIEDTTAPTITTQAADAEVECDGLGNTAALNDWLAIHGGAAATDVCGSVGWSYDPDPATVSDECGETGSVTVTFIATDECGNSSNTIATFTIVDTTDPVIIVEAFDRVVECDGEYNETELTEWLTTNGGAQASDTCGGITWKEPVEVESVEQCGTTGFITMEFIAEDACGHTVSTTATFTIIDTTPPDMVCTSGFAVPEKNASGVATVYWPVPVPIDVCSSNGLAATSPMVPGDTYAVGFHDVPYTVVDDCGNVTTCGFTFEVYLDCNSNSLRDNEEIMYGTAEDLNSNGIPDECDECVFDADCDDGEFCTGVETCNVDTCVAGSNPCTGMCNEFLDICMGGGGGGGADPGEVQEDETDDEGNAEVDNETVGVNISGFPEGTIVALGTTDGGDTTIQLTYPDGTNAMGFVLGDIDERSEVDISIDADGNWVIVITYSDGDVLTLNLNTPPEGTVVNLNRRDDGTFNLVITDTNGDTVDVSIDTAGGGDDVTMTITYNEASNGSPVGRVIAGLAGFVNEESLGGSVDIAIDGLGEGVPFTVAIEYDDADLVGINEADLRLFRLNQAEATYEAPGTNDLGDAEPTGTLSDYGVHTVGNSAWAVVDAAGTFAVGVPAEEPVATPAPNPVPSPTPTPTPAPSPEPGQEVPDDTETGCGAGAAPCGAAGMLSWMLMVGGLAAMKRRRHG